jgi:MFS family permease
MCSSEGWCESGQGIGVGEGCGSVSLARLHEMGIAAWPEAGNRAVVPRIERRFQHRKYTMRVFFHRSLARFRRSATIANSGKAGRALGSWFMKRSELMLAVYLPTALLAVGQGVLLTTIPFLGTSMGLSNLAISTIVSAAALGTLVMDVPAGALLHRVGLRRSMLVGAALVVIGTLSLALPLSIGMLTAMRVLAGVGTAMWGISRHSFIALAVPPSERGRAISTFGGINRIGLFGGPALGGLIAGAMGIHASFIVSGAMALLGLISAALFMSPVSEEHRHQALSTSDRWKAVRTTMRVNAADVTAAGVAQLFAQMIRSGRQILIPLYCATVLDMSVGRVGAVMTISAMIDMVMFVPAGNIMDRYGRKFASVPSFAIMAIGMGMLPLAHSFWAVTAVATIVGLGNGLGSGAMMTLGADLAPPDATGEFLGIWRVIGDFGGVVGPLLVGIVGDALGLSGSSIFLMASGLASAIILLALVKETRQEEPTVVAVAPGSNRSPQASR